jgi:uncharacterized membrane protein YeiH
MLQWIDYIGTGVFAISGALTAYDKKLDIFGISAVAFITALGGGTLRDLLIGNTPVSWMLSPVYLLIISAGILIAMLFRTWVAKLRRTFFFFDTVGIAVFTILGLQKALAIELHPIMAIMMGMVSAVFGGVLRDIVCNEIPLIFRKEIYALACLIGGGLYFLLMKMQFSDDWSIVAAIVFIFMIRSLSVKYHWELPVVR